MDVLLDTAPCGFISSTYGGIVLAVNATLLHLLEYEPGEEVGLPIDAFLPFSSRILYQTYLLPLLEMHGRADEVMLSLQSRSGKTLPMLINAARHERDGMLVDDWILMPMRRYLQYEDEILRSRKAAEEAVWRRNQAIHALEDAHVALEAKQAELVEVNRRLAVLATSDGLTGLKNRRAFQESLTSQIALAERVPFPLSLLMIDVDHFKRINDTYGHPLGDLYLQKVARLLTDHSRVTDVVARYGGEEFAIILPSANAQHAVTTAEKLRGVVETATWEASAITISIGASTLSQDIYNDTLLIATADQALYLSKSNGRNRVVHASIAG